MMAQSTIKELPAAGTPRFTTLTAHRLWLIDNARALFDVLPTSLVQSGGRLLLVG